MNDLGASHMPLWVFFCSWLVTTHTILLQSHPYYISYINPYGTERGLTRVGLGEGLDKAFFYLNEKPNAEKLVVASWYDSTANLYFDGTIKDIPFYEDPDVDYVVTYRNMYGRAEDSIATEVLNHFEDTEPEKVLYIHGLPFAWVYNVQ